MLPAQFEMVLRPFASTFVRTRQMQRCPCCGNKQKFFEHLSLCGFQFAAFELTRCNCSNLCLWSGSFVVTLFYLATLWREGKLHCVKTGSNTVILLSECTVSYNDVSILTPEHNSKSLLPVSYLHLLGNIFSLISYTLLPPPIYGHIKGNPKYYSTLTHKGARILYYSKGVRT